MNKQMEFDIKEEGADYGNKFTKTIRYRHI